MTDELKPCPFCGGTDLKLYGESAPEWWVSCHSCFASSRTQANKANAISAWNTRAALQSQDREDAEWMACDSRRPWVTNSLKHHIKELRAAEKRSRNAFKKDYMGEPARYFADACGEAAALLEAKLDAIDHARRIEGNE